MTIDEQGRPVLTEAVYYRHYCVEAEPCDTVEEALRFLEYGEEWGTLASVGVFVEGEPVRYGYGRHSWPPTAEEAEEMRADYAKRVTEPETASSHTTGKEQR